MKFLSVPVIALILVSSGCSKIKKTDSPIDYPAAYVINGGSSSISIINTETDELVETCPFRKGTWPHHIYTNSAKDQLLVSMVGTDLSGGHAGHGAAAESYLMVLRAKDLKVLNCLKTEAPSHNAIFMQADNEIWIPQMQTAGTVLRLDAKSLKEKSSHEVGSGPLEITKDVNETYAFVCNGESNTVSVLNPETAELVKTISVGGEPVGAWPASNNKMYVDCEVTKEIYEIDVASLTVTDTIPLSYVPAYAAYNSATSALWVSDTESGGVHIYQLSGGFWVESSFITTGANAHAIAFNKDGSKAYVTNQSANTVSVINTGTSVKIKDIAVGDSPNGLLIIE